LEKVRELLAELGFEDLNYRFVRRVNKKNNKKVHVQHDEEAKHTIAKVRNIIDGKSRLQITLLRTGIPLKYASFKDYSDFIIKILSRENMLIELEPKVEHTAFYKIEVESEITCRIIITTDTKTRIQELSILSLSIPSKVKMTQSKKCLAAQEKAQMLGCKSNFGTDAVSNNS
jgi:hypothetical protein